MSDIKIYGKLKSGVTTKALIDATEVSGGFMSLTTDEMNSLSDALKVEGMLVYCTSDSKFYQLKESKWAVALDISASAEVSQPDYNQNDSTAADYIKNRPFYAETGEKMVQIVSGTYTGEAEGEMAYTQFPVTALLVADKPATIKTSQGLEETEVVKSISDGAELIPYIGNFSLMEPGAPNTGETYFFYTAESNGQLVGLFIQTTHFTDMKIEVSQVQITETIVKMPSKYLPDEAATKSDIAVAIEEAITTTLNTDV